MLVNQRHLFDIPDDVHYLNCAYMSPLLKSVVAAGCQGVEAKAHPWEVPPKAFFTNTDKARALFSGLVNAQPEDIAIIPSVSYGIATAVLNLPLEQGDQVLVLAEEFPSNLYAWRIKTRQVGAKVVTLARPKDHDWTRAVLEKLNDVQINIAVLPHTHWIDGGQLDLECIAKVCQIKGISLVLDLTQSLGVVEVDVQKLQPDFLICAAYKWLLGPYSLGFLYAAPKHHAGVSLEQGWVNRPGAEDFSRLIDYVDESNANASRFDMGERSNFHLMPMVIAGLQQIHQWGQANIEAGLRAYTQALKSNLETLGFIACEEAFRSPHYLSVQHPKGLPSNLLADLAKQNIYLSQRGDGLRISPHLYNNEHDAEVLFQALGDRIRK